MWSRYCLGVVALCASRPVFAESLEDTQETARTREELREPDGEAHAGSSPVRTSSETQAGQGPSSAQRPVPKARTWPKSRPDFVLNHWAAEIPMAATSAAVMIGSTLQPQISFSGHSPDAGFHGFHEGADLASDFTGDLGGAVIGLSVGSALEWLHLRRTSFLYSTMVAAEAWLLGSGITRFIKHSVGRCRPLAWNEATGRCDPTLPDPITSRTAEEQYGLNESYQAMPSGHVAGIAAISGSYFWLALQSQEPAPLRWTAFATTQAMALTTVGLRVRAGAHSATDTLVSWGLNSFIGMSVAAFHGRETMEGDEVSFQVVPMGRGVAVAGTF